MFIVLFKREQCCERDELASRRRRSPRPAARCQSVCCVVILFSKSRITFKMVSCIEIETGSLVFATLSLLSTCISSLVCVGLMVHINVLLAFLVNTKQKKVSDFTDLEIKLTNFGLYFNVGLAVALAIVLISLVFSIILTKGLLSKKAHLVKAYFIYGVTSNIISVFSAVVIALFVNIHLGLLSLFGCFLYCIILMMIKGTYEKLSSKDDQFGHKTLEPEKPNV